jgi:signal transduction histidine kinase
MKLVYRLFGSHLAVVLIGLLMLIAVTAYLAPLDFSARMQHSAMMGRGQERLLDLETEYRATLNQALLISGAVGVALSIGLSWWLSQRIVKPLRLLVSVSHEIADGHYEQRLNFKSHDEVGELVQSFNRMAEALASTETLRRELLADVSHELKTPLASIIAYMEGLQDGVIPATPESYQSIQREASRLQRLVLDLQALSQAEAQVRGVKIQAVDLTLLIERLIERFQPQYQEKQIQLRFDTTPKPVLVHADADRLEQVLTNVLGNALQYTHHGGEVTLRIATKSDSTLLSIQDNGVGLSANDQQRIFQRFYRVDKSRARASGGSGIGLTIAKSLLEAQGGRIWAESGGIGTGSTFHIQIPN